MSVLVPVEDQPIYLMHVARIFSELIPVTQTECEIVQRIANSEWRLSRAARLEFGIFAAGRQEFANLFPDEDPNVQRLLVDNQILSAYALQLSVLHRQESRLRRYLDEDLLLYEKLRQQRMQAGDQSKPNGSGQDGVSALKAEKARVAGVEDGS